MTKFLHLVESPEIVHGTTRLAGRRYRSEHWKNDEVEIGRPYTYLIFD